MDGWLSVIVLHASCSGHIDRTVVQLPHCRAMPRSWTGLYNTSAVAARLCFSVWTISFRSGVEWGHFDVPHARALCEKCSSPKVTLLKSGVRGLVVSMRPLVTKLAGSNPAGRIFRAKKSSACLPSEGKQSRISHVAALRRVKEPYNDLEVATVRLNWSVISRP
jgi:hypothetical protein